MKLSIVHSYQPAQFQAATFKGDLGINLAKIAALGYEGVELSIRDPGLVDVEGLERMIHQYKLSIPAIGTGQAWGEEGLSLTDPDASIRQAAIRRIQAHIPLASRFNALIIIGLMRGTRKGNVESTRVMDWLVQGLRECSQASGSSGVKLILEPINRYETSLINNAAEARELIERVGAGNIGLLLDTFHMNIEEPSIEAAIRSSAGKLLHFHVADSNREHPGAGHLDFKAILKALSDTGYTGWVSGEYLPRPDAVTAAQRGIAHLRQSA